MQKHLYCISYLWVDFSEKALLLSIALLVKAWGFDQWLELKVGLAYSVTNGKWFSLEAIFAIPFGFGKTIYVTLRQIQKTPNVDNTCKSALYIQTNVHTWIEKLFLSRFVQFALLQQLHRKQ